MTRSSQSRSTRSSWWLENSTGTPDAACVAQQVDHRVDGERVEAAERLVEHQGGRVVDQRRGDLHPLLVAERQRLDAVARALAEAEPLEVASARGSRGVRGRHPVQPAEVDELVGDLHAWGTARAPRACSRTGAGRASVIGRPSQSTSPGVGREHAHDDPHRRRLAGPVGADEAGQPPRAGRRRSTSSTARTSPKRAGQSPCLDLSHATDARRRPAASADQPARRSSALRREDEAQSRTRAPRPGPGRAGPAWSGVRHVGLHGGLAEEQLRRRSRRWLAPRHEHEHLALPVGRARRADAVGSAGRRVATAGRTAR